MKLGEKAITAALKTVSSIQPDVRKTYKLQRAMDRLGQASLLKPLYPKEDLTIPGKNGDIPVRVFFPSEKPYRGLILFTHGGGWVTGDVETYSRVCALTARKTGYLVASVDYRLAPEYKFPTGVEDCFDAAKWFFANSESRWQVKPEDIVLMGDSAGGNLTAVTSLKGRDENAFFPRRQVLLYPATYPDHTEASPYASVRENGTAYLLTSQRIEEYVSLYQNSPLDRKSPYFAPLLAKDLSNQPETLIITAQLDPLRDEGEDYGLRLRQAGNRVWIFQMENALHGFFSLPAAAPAVKKTFDILLAFLEQPEQLEEMEHGKTERPMDEA
jgi:acetyl esterase